MYYKMKDLIVKLFLKYYLKTIGKPNTFDDLHVFCFFTEIIFKLIF